MIIVGMSFIEECKKEINFLKFYYILEFILVVNVEGKYINVKNISDFKNVKVIV